MGTLGKSRFVDALQEHPQDLFHQAVFQGLLFLFSPPGNFPLYGMGMVPVIPEGTNQPFHPSFPCPGKRNAGFPLCQQASRGV